MEMRKIEGHLDISMSVEEISYINELIDRDRTMLPNLVTGSTGSELRKCPLCNHTIYSSEVFCAKCGQRIDPKDGAL